MQILDYKSQDLAEILAYQQRRLVFKKVAASGLSAFGIGLVFLSAVLAPKDQFNNYSHTNDFNKISLGNHRALVISTHRKKILEHSLFIDASETMIGAACIIAAKTILKPQPLEPV